MIEREPFPYVPGEHECEKASNSYLMSMVVIMVGLPIPIVNLIASLIFYYNNRRGTYFVRWHSMQALFSQLLMFMLNSTAFWWTVSILFEDETWSNDYMAYVIGVLAFNLLEFIGTIIAAMRTRKGIHVEWWIIGDLTHVFCRP